MLKNYIEIAFRNLWRQRLFSFVNIVGLASGMTVCLLALIQVKGAFDYDTFHPNADRIYRILTDMTRHQETVMSMASTPLPLADLLTRDYDVAEQITRVRYGLPDKATANDKTLPITGVFVDPGFYTIFGFRLATGYPATEAGTVVLTRATADRFFPKQNPIGKTLTVGHFGQLTVTGIMEKPPYPSHLRFDIIVSMATLSQSSEKGKLMNWQDEAAGYTYVQLKKGISSTVLQTALNAAAKRINGGYLATANRRYGFRWQSLARISPGNEPLYNITAEPIMPNLLSMGILALVVLLLAGFNYVNLTLIRSLGRAREVGVRKAVGALKSQLIGQFLTESTVVALLAFGLAYGQLKFVSQLPTVQRLIEDVRQDGFQWAYFLVFVLLTGLIAGWVPAQTLASHQPAQVLRGFLETRLFRGLGLRRTLIVSQFAATLIALIFLAVFYRQSSFMATTDYGFNRQRILTVSLNKPGDLTMATEVSKLAGVEQVAATSAEFGFSGGYVRFIRSRRSGDSIQATAFSVTPTLVQTVGLKVIAGQNLPRSTNDSASYFVLVNEEAVRMLKLGTPSEAVGKTVWLNDSTERQVVGVVRDFHHSNLLRRINSLVLYNQPREFRVLMVKVISGADEAVLAGLSSSWKRHNPYVPIETRWLDEHLKEQHLHRDDRAFIGLLTGMALLIACLGLLGMVTYTIETRIKEVGIRKVMGATFWQIMQVLSKEFVWLLLLAALVGLPLGFGAGQAFLQQYAYHTSVGLGLLLACSLLLFSIGGLIIGWKTYRAALMNPVKSLRSE